VTFEVYSAAGTVTSCAQPVLGAPFIFADGVGLEARGRVEGTGAAVDVIASLRFRGTTTQPAVVQIRIVEAQIELAFAAGAYGEITADVNTVLNGVSTEFASASVTVDNSAVTGV
jgi:hypothetical protein